jgi:hypothetical protein
MNAEMQRKQDKLSLHIDGEISEKLEDAGAEVETCIQNLKLLQEFRNSYIKKISHVF